MVCAVDEKTQAGKKYLFYCLFVFVNKAYVYILFHLIKRNNNVNIKYKIKIIFIIMKFCLLIILNLYLSIKINIL